jgi:hypothetical protein
MRSIQIRTTKWWNLRWERRSQPLRSAPHKSQVLSGRANLPDKWGDAANEVFHSKGCESVQTALEMRAGAQDAWAADRYARRSCFARNILREPPHRRSTKMGLHMEPEHMRALNCSHNAYNAAAISWTAHTEKRSRYMTWPLCCFLHFLFSVRITNLP